MRLLVLFTQPWRVGGAETHVEALFTGMADTDEVTLAVNEGSDGELLASLQERFPKLRLLTIQARGANPVQWWQSLQGLVRYIRQVKIDCISAQQRTAGLWSWYLQWKTGVPFVVTMHDSWHRAIGKRSYGGVFPLLVIVGLHLKRVAIEQFGFQAEQLIHIGNGVDFSRFKPGTKQQARQNLGRETDDLLLLHVSRLSSIKGAVALVLIKAMQLISSAGLVAQLHIIGEGPLRDEVDKAARECNQKIGRTAVICHNFTPQIIEWYQAADVIIGEGRVAIESLACERPVVAIRNAQSFLGTVQPHNVAEAIRLNFDGRAMMVTPETLAQEIVTASTLDETKCQQTAQHVRETLSIEGMTQAYRQVFQASIQARKRENHA